MMNLVNRLAALLRGEKGQGFVEYLLLICLVFVLIIGAWAMWSGIFMEWVGHFYAYFITHCGCI